MLVLRVVRAVFTTGYLVNRFSYRAFIEQIALEDEHLHRAAACRAFFLSDFVAGPVLAKCVVAWGAGGRAVVAWWFVIVMFEPEAAAVLAEGTLLPCQKSAVAFYAVVSVHEGLGMSSQALAPVSPPSQAKNGIERLDKLPHSELPPECALVN